jgi:Phage integrase, N-terminal SAM-like domain
MASDGRRRRGCVRARADRQSGRRSRARADRPATISSAAPHFGAATGRTEGLPTGLKVAGRRAAISHPADCRFTNTVTAGAQEANVDNTRSVHISGHAIGVVKGLSTELSIANLLPGYAVVRALPNPEHGIHVSIDEDRRIAAPVLSLTDPATGKRKLKCHSFKGTKREAQVECARLISEMKQGAYVQPSKLTLAQFFDRWLASIKPNVSPRTHERYEQIATKDIVPLIGARILSKLQPIDISEAYAKALETGRRDGKGGLSPRTVHHMHRVLYSALSQAERWKLVVRNPAALLERRDRPKIERKSVRTIDAPTTAMVFDAARESACLFP